MKKFLMIMLILVGSFLHADNDSAFISTAVWHMAKGFALSTGSCVPLLVLGGCNADHINELDEKFIALAGVMPAVPWMIKHISEASAATDSKLALKKNNSMRQEVANRWAKAAGSTLGPLCLLVMIHAAYND